MHVSAVERDPSTFEHIDPALVGNEPHVLVSELSGRATILRRAKEIGLPLHDEKELADRVLRHVKAKEHEGYHFEAADASFELLLRGEMGVGVEFFQLESFRIIDEKREDGQTVSEATVKVLVDGERFPERQGHPACQLQRAYPGRKPGHRGNHPRALGFLRRMRVLG
jgi:2-isopropylmalate synthase